MSLIKPDERIFVAGHRGMAGSAICRALLRSGYSNLLTANRKELDLLNLAAVKSWFKAQRPEVVVLAAAKVGGIEANRSTPFDFLLENLNIQNNVIETAWRSGVRRLLFLGSSCIYPKNALQPLREELLLTGPLEPTNESYAIAKIAGLKLCEALRNQVGFDAISLMPTNLYGPNDNYVLSQSHMMAAMIRRFCEASRDGAPSVVCWGTGKPRREMLHVDDLGEACVFALAHWQPKPNEIPYINVGTGVDLRISELANLVAQAIGYSGEIQWDHNKPDGTPQKLLDVSRMAELGWRAKIPLVEGIKRTILGLPQSFCHRTAN